MRGRLRVSRRQRKRQEVPLPVPLAVSNNNPNGESTDFFNERFGHYNGPTVYDVPKSWKEAIDKT